MKVGCLVPGTSAVPFAGYETAQWIAASRIFFLEESQTDAQSARWPGAQPADHFPFKREEEKLTSVSKT